MLYFAENENDLKIGYADDVSRRMKQHEGYGFKLLAAMPGTHDDEQKLLAHFKPFVRRGKEFFSQDDEIYKYIRILLEKGFAHHEPEVAAHLPELPFVTWGPEHLQENAIEVDGQITIFSRLPERNRIAVLASQAQNHSLTDEWYTPEDIVGLVKTTFGGIIDTDPATSVAVNMKFIKAKIFYTKHTNGLDLSRPWSGNLWLNPPYGRGEGSAGDFVARLTDEVMKGNVTQAITCLNIASMTSRWFFSTVPKCVKLHCLVNGRPNFIPPTGKSDSSSPNKGIVLSYFGGNQNKFYEVFNSIGQILQPRATV